MSPIQDALTSQQARIGQEVGISNWITVDQPMIDQFAETTQDDQWIHVDPERARRDTPFGNTVAHGFLTLSLASRFFYDVLSDWPGQIMGLNYGFDKLRFLTPVVAGARVRGRFVLKDVRIRNPNELLQTHVLTIEIEGQDKPALVADWLGLAIFDAEG